AESAELVWRSARREAAVLEEADAPAVLGRRAGNRVLADLLAGLDVPDAQGVVAEDGAADGLLAVGRERHGPHLARVTLAAANLLAGFQVPPPPGRVFSAREQPLAVARHVQPVDRALVALVAVQFLAAYQIPDANRPVGASRNGFPAARQEGQTVHALGVPLQLQQFLARGHVPQAHGRVTVSIADAAGEGPLAVG